MRGVPESGDPRHLPYVFPEMYQQDFEGQKAIVAWTDDGQPWVELLVHDATEPFDPPAICHQCRGVVATGQRLTRADIPISRVGMWKCTSCGGWAERPPYLILYDFATRQRMQAYSPIGIAHVSAITAAELLRLSQAARAVQQALEGAEERLDRVLQEAPEPVRRLRDLKPQTRSDWIALASLIVALVTALMPLVQSGDAVTKEQLDTIVERIVESHREGHATNGQEQHRAGSGDPRVEAPDEGSMSVGREGRPQS
jgi:hypothetical protein